MLRLTFTCTPAPRWMRVFRHSWNCIVTTHFHMNTRPEVDEGVQTLLELRLLPGVPSAHLHGVVERVGPVAVRVAGVRNKYYLLCL